MPITEYPHFGSNDLQYDEYDDDYEPSPDVVSRGGKTPSKSPRTSPEYVVEDEYDFISPDVLHDQASF